MIVHENIGFDGIDDLGKSRFKKIKKKIKTVAKKVKRGMLVPEPLRRKHLGWKKPHQPVVMPQPLVSVAPPTSSCVQVPSANSIQARILAVKGYNIQTAQMPGSPSVTWACPPASIYANTTAEAVPARPYIPIVEEAKPSLKTVYTATATPMQAMPSPMATPAAIQGIF